MFGHVLYHEVVVVRVTQNRIHTFVGSHNHKTLRLQGKYIITVNSCTGKTVGGFACINQLHTLLANSTALSAPTFRATACVHKGIPYLHGLRRRHMCAGLTLQGNHRVIPDRHQDIITDNWRQNSIFRFGLNERYKRIFKKYIFSPSKYTGNKTEQK